MNSANPVGGSPTHFDYYAIAKATVTSVALMALSVGAMEGIQHYAKRTITPLQRNFAGVILTALYMTAAARLHGPFTKTPPPPSDKRKPPETGVHPRREVRGQGGLSERFPQHDLLQGDPNLASKLPTQPEISFPIGLPADRRRMDSSRKDQRESRTFHGAAAIPPRSQHQDGGIERHPLSLLLDFTQVRMEEEASGSYEENGESVDPLAVGSYREVNKLRERQLHLLGPQELSRSPIDLTRVNPRIIKRALKTFRQAIISNGYTAVGCALPLEGRVVLVRVDISTRKKQLEALRICQQWYEFFQRGQIGTLPQIQTEPPLVIIEPPDARGMGKQLLSVEDARPRRGLEDSVFILVENPARPDESMVVNAATYDVEVHGVNGYRMKQKLYTSLFGEFAHLLQEKMKVDPMTKLKQIEAVSYCWRSREDHLLMWVLHYLLREGQQGYHVMVSGEEARYWDFINAHEALMSDYQGKEKTYNQDVIAWSRAIANVRMTPRIQSYQESLVAAHYLALPNMTAKTFHQAFAMRNDELKRADSRMKLWWGWSETSKAQGATSYCNYFGVNPPNLRKVETWTSDRGESREIFYLRHSTPHSGAAITKAPVDLTYREFLRSAETEGHGVIYAIHQRLDDYGAKVEQEGYRVQSILDLEETHPNFLPLVQSVESDLFKKGKRTFTELKKAILDSFRQKTGARRNRLPRFLVEDRGETLAINHAYEAQLNGILNFVQRVFFPREGDAIDQDKVDYYGGLTDPAHLTNESQAFIMLFYHFQREHLKFADLSDYGYGYQVKYVNSGCKDDYDRGGGQNGTTDRVHQHQVHGADVPQADLEATLSSIQAPPIQGKGIPAIKYRLHPALFVSSMLANLSEGQLQELQAVRWNGWSLASYDVGRRVGQTAV